MKAKQSKRSVMDLPLAVACDIARYVNLDERQRCTKIATDYARKCRARGPSWEDHAVAADAIAAKIRNGR